LDNPITYDDFTVDNLIVTTDCSLNVLSVTGQSTVQDLIVKGNLVLDNPITYDDFTVDNLIVTTDCSLNKLNVSGQSTVQDLIVTTDCSLNVLDVSGQSTLNNVTIKGVLTLDQPITYDDFEVDNLNVR
jgi:hypothetical protein